MKYVTYLIFTAFVVVTILFLKNALEPENEPVALTGSVKCGECHSLLAMGDQQTIWERSAHYKAFTTLLSERSRTFIKSKGLQEADSNKVCLRCHTTRYFLGDAKKLSSYNINEGVGCEACHGAGSKYSPDEVMKSPQQFKKAGGLISGEETCIKCHNLEANKEQILNENICPFQTEGFVYKTAFEKIKHPLNKENFK